LAEKVFLTFGEFLEKKDISIKKEKFIGEKENPAPAVAQR